MRNKIKPMLIITMLLLSLAIVFPIPVSANPNPINTRLYVDPMNNTFYSDVKPMGSTFSVNITIFNVTDLYGAEIHLFWDAILLECIGATMYVPSIWWGPDTIFNTDDDLWFAAGPGINQTSGRYDKGIIATPPAPSFNSTGATAFWTLTFKITSYTAAWGHGKCLLDLRDTSLGDSNGLSIPHTEEDGIYQYIWVAPLYTEVNTKGTYFEVIPAKSTQNLGQNFTIDINVTNAPAQSHDWQVSLRWNSSVLNVTLVTAGVLSPATMIFKESLAVANAKGNITMGQSMIGAATFSGNNTLVTVKFLVLANGSSGLELVDTLLINLAGVKTYYPNNDGFFRETTAWVHDVAVTGVWTDATEVAWNGTVAITVTVKNEGNYNQTFEVRVFADTVTHDSVDPDVVMVGDEITIAAYNVTVAAELTNTTTVNWTPGNISAETYNISAAAIKLMNGLSVVDDNPHDNIFIDCTVKIIVDHDLKISSVIVPSWVWSRDKVKIEFTVVNQGNTTETNFLIVIRADGTLVETVTIVSLERCGASNTTSIEWDTTGWARGTWIVKVIAPDLGERGVDLADNVLTATIVIKPVYDRAVVSVATVTTYLWTSANGSVRVTVKNEGTENDTFQIILYADQFVANVTQTPVLMPGESWTVTLIWRTKGQFAEGRLASKLVTWVRKDNRTTQFWVYSEVRGGSYSLTVFLPFHPTERPEDRADNYNTEGLPILVDQIPADLNLDGKVDSGDGIIWGKLLGESRP